MQNEIDMAELAGADITSVIKENLADVTGLILDTAIPGEQRTALVVEKVKNPYCFRVGGMGVKLEFSDHGPTLQKCLTNFLQRKKNGL